MKRKRKQDKDKRAKSKQERGETRKQEKEEGEKKLPAKQYNHHPTWLASPRRKVRALSPSKTQGTAVGRAKKAQPERLVLTCQSKGYKRQKREGKERERESLCVITFSSLLF